MLEIVGKSLEAVADEVAKLVKELVDSGRNDLLLRAIGVPVLEELRIEAAKARLSRLLITKDYRFLLVDYGNKEVMLRIAYNGDMAKDVAKKAIRQSMEEKGQKLHEQLDQALGF